MTPAKTILALGGLLLATRAQVDAPLAEDRATTNVLLVLADDLGLQLGCYGETAIETPHLDALAASGTRFDVAWVSQASCSPSRSSIFTGLYPHANGQYGLRQSATDFQLFDELTERTLPALLAAAGYRTGIIGKLHVGPKEAFPFDLLDNPNTRDVRDVAQRAAAFLAETEGPFFLVVSYVDPHVWRKFGENVYQTRSQGLPAEALRPVDTPPLPFQGIDSPEQRRRTAGYFNAVKRLDEGVGLLLDALEGSGHGEDTLVLFVSDHGPPFSRAKTTCYEAGLRVPLIVRWPGVTHRPQATELVSTVDLMPTVLEAAGLALPADLHGRSLRPLLADGDAPWRTYLAGEFNYHGKKPFFPRRAIRDQRFKLIHNLRAGSGTPSVRIDRDTAFDQSQATGFEDDAVRRAFARLADPPEFELYDLAADPWEFHDLAEDPRWSAELTRLKEALLAWREATADPLLHATKLPRTSMPAK